MCDVVDNEWLITTPSADLGTTTADLRHAAAGDVVVACCCCFCYFSHRQKNFQSINRNRRKRREWREREPKKQERNHCHGPRTGCIAQSIDPGPYDTIKNKGTEGKTQRPSRHIGVNVLKSQRKELLPGIHRWRRRINVLSQKKSKSWITWLYRAVCLPRPHDGRLCAGAAA